MDYVFPILRYHSKWSELTKTDVQYMFDTKTISHNGYYMRVDVKPAENVPSGRILSDYSFGENAWKYLDMMTALCKEKGIRLILIKAPSLYPYWYDEWEAQVEDNAEKNGLTYINFMEIGDETGGDYNTNNYDADLHMKLSSAEKLSRWLGRMLTEQVEGIHNRQNEETLSAIWEEKIAAYEAEKQEQYIRYGIKE